MGLLQINTACVRCVFSELIAVMIPRLDQKQGGAFVVESGIIIPPLTKTPSDVFFRVQVEVL